ncbi:MAG: hypothetical protein M0Q90_01400 [Bacteroidales bacterium]|nr:hypothetical protein [Bacteroidales bacterium]
MNSQKIRAQQNNRFPEIEQFSLFTDRSIYATGENIAFAAFQLTDSLPQVLLSRVLYVELISPQADQLSAGKYTLSTQGAQGKLEIPEDLNSGNYYLRAYTKYMRNIGPEAYAYALLKVVNPEKAVSSFLMDSVNFLSLSKVQNDRLSSNIPKDTIFSEKNIREILPSISQEDLISACVSIVPANSFADNYYAAEHKRYFNRIEYLPETNGLSISGLLKNNENDSVIVGARIKLSIIGNGRDFLATETNEEGRFLLALPAYSGRRDLFVCTENSLENAADLLIDNDYCRIPIQLPDTIFSLNDAEKAVALHLINNQRISLNFYENTLTKDTFPAAFNKVFYGTPSEIVRLSNYVELPNLEEYFNELPTLAKVRKKQGKKYFKVLSNNAEIPVFEPLVMVDQVAIDNTEAVLAVSPKQIERIEIINAPYIKGAFTYGGIIHLISKEGYFADIDLPKNGLFLDYQFFNPKKTQLKNKDVSHENPEAANTIYWNPLVTASELEKGISYRTPALAGNYELLVRGTTKEGKAFSTKYLLVIN